MVDVNIVKLTKRFGEVTAVDGASLHINEGEFFTLLGPSGCGKTTTLRLVAGFYRPDEGEIYFGEKLINRIPPNKRDTGMVFQNYALWPHMNVFNNVAYGLKLRKMTKREISKKVENALSLVELGGMGDRSPSQLSGGQQQRVALARALVIEPKVLLLDEPLSNLDAKLRVQMRIKIKEIQKELGITSIYVTHDQEEALCISDRTAVMNEGNIEQIGTPREIYEEPNNEFVADFIGLTNFMKGTVLEVREEEKLAVLETSHGNRIEALVRSGEVEKDQRILISVRPEAIEVIHRSSMKEDLNVIDGVVKTATYLGDIVRYEFLTEHGDEMKADVHNPRYRQIFSGGDKVSAVFERRSARLIPI